MESRRRRRAAERSSPSFLSDRRTPRGRILTASGFGYLGLPAPERDLPQLDLLDGAEDRGDSEGEAPA